MNPHRLDAIEKNVEWLREADVDGDEGRIEAAKRLGLIKGDARALVRELSEGGEQGSAPSAEWTLRLTPEELDYLRERRRLDDHRVIVAEDGTKINLTVSLVGESEKTNKEEGDGTV